MHDRRQRGAAGASPVCVSEPELVQRRPDDREPQRPVHGFEIPGRGALFPDLPHPLASDGGRQRERRTREKARAVNRDLNIRDDLFPGARHSHDVGRTNLVHQRRQTLIRLPDVRNHACEQRDIECDGTAHAVRQRQLAHDAVRARAHFRHHFEKAQSETDDVGALRAVGCFGISGGARREDDGAGQVGGNLAFQL